MPPTSVRIGALRPADSLAVADLHRDCIPQGFLSRLGRQFRAAMYRGIASAPNSGVWVALDDHDRVVGFISGSANLSRCYKSVLLRRGVQMAVFALPAAGRWETWKHVAETLAYPRREITRAARSDGQAEPTAELLSIVVAPEARGTDAAGKLVEALENGLAHWGHCGPYRVVTMAADPRSNAFYIKVGFRHVRGFSHHGINMNLYHKVADEP